MSKYFYASVEQVFSYGSEKGGFGVYCLKIFLMCWYTGLECPLHICINTLKKLVCVLHFSLEAGKEIFLSVAHDVHNFGHPIESTDVFVCPEFKRYWG